MESTEGVRTFVGIDAHSGQCSIKAISDQGEEILQVDVPTTATRLQRALKGLEGPVWAMVESSCIAPLVKDSIEKAVDRVVVCETRENRWIARSENKSDQADADRLARLLRMGEFKEVHVPRGLRRDRLEVLRLYRKVQGDAIRTKNRIKSKYRENGVRVPGKKVYSPRHRDEYLKKIDRSQVLFMLEALYEKLDNDEAACDRILKRLFSLMKGTREHRVLKTIPGVGDLLASIMAAVIDDPWRFASKRQLWSYSALGVRSRWSGDPSNVRVKGSNSGNRLMKYAAMSAAKAALRGDNRFSRHYRKMVGDGVCPAMARRTVARQILATALAMLKSGEAYEEKRS
jgi:transposase